VSGQRHSDDPLTRGKVAVFFSNKQNSLGDRTGWLGREDSNLRMAESKSAALPLGYAPMTVGMPPTGRQRAQDNGAAAADQCADKCKIT
jgi:hypothetical protein